MVENNVELKKENNDFFREWIIEEWKHHNTVDTIYQLRIIKPEELKFQDNEEYYKIMYNNEMVGFIGIKNFDKEIYLYRFFIEEKYRNQGVGTVALNKIIKLAKDKNKDMSLEVIGDNIARDLYERLGFKTHYRKMVLKVNDNIYEN
ncbi:MAG: GNAT family N-acetyltransferase [Bacilli bacterium]|nr:GNAT family N-acetyltransferase [Bacilli bacterium]